MVVQAIQAWVSQTFNDRPSLAIASALLVVLLVSRLYATFEQYWRLHHIKGPFLAGLSQLWLCGAVTSKQSHLEFWEVTKKYGFIARVAPNDLVTSDAELMRRILSARSPYRRAIFYEAMRFDPGKESILSYRDERQHNRLRSMMLPGYSGRDVEHLESSIDSHVLNLIKLIAAKVGQGEEFDVAQKVHYFALDIVTGLAFGKEFGCLRTDSDVHGYIAISEKVLPVIMLTSVFPWMVKILTNSMVKPFLSKNMNQLGFGEIMGVAKNVAKERFGPGKTVRKDMLGSFISRGLTQDEVQSEILLLLFVVAGSNHVSPDGDIWSMITNIDSRGAGSDTVAAATSIVIWNVVQKAPVLRRLQEEIDNFAADATKPIIANTEALDLPYLQATIKEALRMYPPVPALLSKEAPLQGDTWKGVHIPGGTRIGFSFWGVFRDEAFWGRNASEFCPERWLDNDPEKLSDMNAQLDLVFSQGRWECLGRRIAQYEMNKVIFEIFRRFDFTFRDESQPCKLTHAGVLVLTDLWVTGHRRNTSQCS